VGEYAKIFFCQQLLMNSVGFILGFRPNTIFFYPHRHKINSNKTLALLYPVSDRLKTNLHPYVLSYINIINHPPCIIIFFNIGTRSGRKDWCSSLPRVLREGSGSAYYQFAVQKCLAFCTYSLSMTSRLILISLHGMITFRSQLSTEQKNLWKI